MRTNELTSSIETKQMFLRFMYIDTFWLPALSRPQVTQSQYLFIEMHCICFRLAAILWAVG